MDRVPTPRTWVDLTDLQGWTGPPTGIQRVVVELARRLLADAPTTTLTCAFDPTTGQFHEVEATRLGYDSARAGSEVAPAVAPPRVRDRVPAPLARAARGVRSTLQATVRPTTTPTPAITSVEPFLNGDRLVVIGANWLTPGYAEHLVELATDLGLDVTQVVYDLIPSLHPQWAATGAAEIVTPFLRAVLPVCRTIVAISQNTADDIDRFVALNQLVLRPDVGVAVMPLGADPLDAAGASPPAGIDPNAEFLLCVGTLEVRKNQFVLYQAYREAARRDLALPVLYFAGRTGWLADSTVHAIRNDPAVAGKLHILDSVTEQELAWLYSHCLFTLYPSLYEGWGLPVGESLQHHKVCVTTDQASIPEVGGDLAEYVSPFDAAAWLAAITRYVDPERRQARETLIATEYHPRSWDDVFITFRAAINHS